MRTLALCGNSLVMSSISAGLRDRAELRLVHLDATAPEAEQQLDALEPDAVIFDLASAEADRAVALMKSHPRFLWIGVDLAANKALVLSGQSTCVRTGDDLMQLIESRERPDDALQREFAAPDDAPGIPGTDGRT